MHQILCNAKYSHNWIESRQLNYANVYSYFMLFFYSGSTWYFVSLRFVLFYVVSYRIPLCNSSRCQLIFFSSRPVGPFTPPSCSSSFHFISLHFVSTHSLNRRNHLLLSILFTHSFKYASTTNCIIATNDRIPKCETVYQSAYCTRVEWAWREEKWNKHARRHANAMKLLTI